MTSPPPEADAAADRFVLDGPPAGMGREGAYDVKEREEKADAAAAGGKLGLARTWRPHR